MKVRMILPSLHVQRELHQIDLSVAGVEFEENEIVSCREQQELCVFVWDGAGDGLLAFVCLRARCCCQCDSEQEGKEVRNCEEIGEVGDIASLNGIKLYFQVSEGTQTVDPLQWLKTK